MPLLIVGKNDVKAKPYFSQSLSATKGWQKFLEDLGESMANARKAIPPKNERISPSSSVVPEQRSLPVVARCALRGGALKVRSGYLENLGGKDVTTGSAETDEATTDSYRKDDSLHQTRPRDITPTPEDRMENHRRLQRAGIIHAASAELMALAESLHKGPPFQQSIQPNNSQEGNFELPSTQIVGQNGSVYEPRNSIPTGPNANGGLLTPTSAHSDTDTSSPQRRDSGISFHNRFDPLTSLRESSSDTDPDIDQENVPGGIDWSPKEIVVDSFMDPELRKEQALLWKILSDGPADDVNNEKLTVEERKQLFEATKRSWVDQEERFARRLGINLSADFTASDGLTQSDDEDSDAYESSSIESDSASETIHASTQLRDGATEPLLPSQDADAEDTISEPASEYTDHPGIFRKKRREDCTSSDSTADGMLAALFRSPTATPSSFRKTVSQRHESDSSHESYKSCVNGMMAALCRSPTSTPSSSRKTVSQPHESDSGYENYESSDDGILTTIRTSTPTPTSTAVRPQAPPFLKYLPNTPQAQRSFRATTSETKAEMRGRARRRKPLMGLFGSANRARAGSTPRKGKCNGFGCDAGKDKENA